MDNQLLEELLHEDEKESLDFKRDQYPFDRASDTEKAHLLKDILAMANAWRREPAFILIGVEEVKGGRSKIIGVQNQLEDSNVQQFVNSKTNKPLQFKCSAYSAEGKSIGVIELPVLSEQRPFYLVSRYDGLQQETVYLRRGSSTDTASPEEICQMGRASVQVAGPAPDLLLEFANLGLHEVYKDGVGIEGSVLHPISPDLIRPRPRPTPLFAVPPMGEYGNYYEDLIAYTHFEALMSGVGLAITNKSGVTATNVLVSAEILRQDELLICDEYDRPAVPHKLALLNTPARPFEEHDVVVQSYPDRWELRVRWDRVLPGETAWSQSEFYIGSTKTTQVTLDAKVYAEELPAPFEVKLPLFIRVVEERDMTKTDVFKWESTT